MPSEQHERLVDAIWKFLDRKLSGCLDCEMSRDSFARNPEDHEPTPSYRRTPVHSEILFFCEKQHPHQYNLLFDAAYAEKELRHVSPQRPAISCRPDITLLNAHRDPVAFLEIEWKHEVSDSARSIAEELDIPVFVFKASSEYVAVVPPLYRNLPYFESMTGMTEEDRRNMRALHHAASALFDKGKDDPSAWHEATMVFGDQGDFHGSTIHHPEVAVDGDVPLLGGMLFANRCFWNCEKVVEKWKWHHEVMSLDAKASMRKDLVENLGELVKSAMESVPDFHRLRRTMGRGSPAEGYAEFVWPIGSEQVRIGMTIEPLDQTVSPGIRKLSDALRQEYLRHFESADGQ